MGPRKCIFAVPLLLLSVAAGRAAEPPATPVATHETARTIEVRVVARKPEGGVRTVRVVRGDTVALTVRADEKLAVHVHGYDVHADAAPGAPASLTFPAQFVGRFPIAAHLPAPEGARHGPEPTLLYLEVLPE